MSAQEKKICSHCFELILPNEEWERVGLPDGSRIFFHKVCLEEMMEDEENNG